MLKRYWDNTPSYLKNKYVLTIIVFSFWMLFFDQHNLISQLQLQSELSQYETDKEYYQDKITRTEQDLNNLLTNEDNLEKFAREKYLMKKDNEDVFVIVAE
ncbi:MAG: septum formation initiator family protein [Flavobacteriales bacterium]|nr:septum formation initiator family protein [Flavobacteriales bacterium]